MSDQLPPAGWYPAPHANNEQRYWDGAQWLEPTPVPALGDHAATALYPTETVYPTNSADQSQPKKSRKGWIIGGSIAAGVLLIGGVGSALGMGENVPESKPESTATPSSAPVVEEEPTTFIEVPDVSGMTVIDAIARITAVGLKAPEITTFDDPTAIVLSTEPKLGYEVEEGRTIVFTVEEKPKFTLGQQNAISKAQSYLRMTGFSRTGLIGQLEYEGFSTDDAAFGADNSGADWNAECAEKAQSYLDMTSFSRDGLYDQLAYEGFSAEQIEFGLATVGY